MKTPFGLPIYVAPIDSVSARNLTLSGLPIHVARIPAAPFRRAPLSFSLGLRMKLLLAVLALISVDSVAADCPRLPIGPARSTPSTIPFMPTHQIVSYSSPRQSLERCSRGNGNIRRERSGIWITTPGLEARMAKLASRFASPSRRSRRIRQLFPCHIRSCLTPSTRPNGTRCTWTAQARTRVLAASRFHHSARRLAVICVLTSTALTN